MVKPIIRRKVIEMKRAINKSALFAVVAALGAFCAPADDATPSYPDVLFWLVNDTAKVTVDGMDEDMTFKEYLDFASYSYAADSGLTARIRAVGNGVSSEDPFLLVYSPTFENFQWGGFGVKFGTTAGDDQWGAFFPYNQSPLVYNGLDADGYTVNYDYTAPDISIVVEIGNQTNEGGWTSYFNSDPVSYDDIKSYIKPFDNLGTTQYTPWVPHFSVVPEPSGGLLTMFGMALLALRRRRRVVA